MLTSESSAPKKSPTRHEMNISKERSEISLKIINPTMRDVGSYALKAEIQGKNGAPIVQELAFNLTVKGILKSWNLRIYQ